MNTFTQDQLEAAFSAVQNTSDWKAPIDAKVGTSLLSLACAAVEHFTATKAKVEQVGPDTFRITSPGYRQGPAGDH